MPKMPETVQENGVFYERIVFAQPRNSHFEKIDAYKHLRRKSLLLRTQKLKSFVEERFRV